LPNRTSVDEIQILGGSSWYKFVGDTNKDAARDIPVKRDFNANEAIALGAVYSTLQNKEVSPLPETLVMRNAVADVNLFCNTSHSYCRRGERCVGEIAERNGKCSTVYLIAVPEGHSPVIATFSISGAENETKDEYIKFGTKVDDPFMRGGKLCNEMG
jgi:hypothetical protein